MTKRVSRAHLMQHHLKRSLPGHVDESKHPVVEEVRAIDAKHQVATGLQEPVGHQLAAGWTGARGDGPPVKNLFKVFLREGRGKRERSFAEMY